MSKFERVILEQKKNTLKSNYLYLHSKGDAEIIKNTISGSLTIVTANFVKIICIELDMLHWLMTNSFVASVFILAILDPWNSFTYKLEGCCKHLQMW